LANSKDGFDDEMLNTIIELAQQIAEEGVDRRTHRTLVFAARLERDSLSEQLRRLQNE